MKHFYPLFISLILIPVFSFAQNNFKPGYVISLQGDTLKGLIDYKEWNTNPSEITFKRSADAKADEYTAATINGFGVTGYEYYSKFILSVGNDRTDVANLSRGVNTSVSTDTLFLKVLVSGKNVTLYRYWDNIKERFFIAEAGKSPAELVYRVYVDADQGSNIVKQYVYRHQLEIIAAEEQNNSLQNIIRGADYTDKDLQKIAILINGNNENKQFTSSSQSGTRFFAGVGLNVSSVKSTGSSDFAGSKSSAFPDVNVGVDFFQNKDIRSLIIRLEFSFTENKTSLTGAGGGFNTYTSKLSFNQALTTFNPQLLYNFYNTADTKVYIAAGLVVDFAAYSNKYYVQTPTGSGFGSYSPAFPDLKSIIVDGDVKAGVELNSRINIYASYTPPILFNSNGGYTFKLSSYQAGINYLFGVK